MADLANFDRQYRMAAGPVGGTGFEVGEATKENPVPLRVEFSFQKSDLQTQNTGKLTIWNLSKDHLAVLAAKDCALAFRAGYGRRISLIFAGIVSFLRTSMDGADRKTEIEVVDNLVQIRDTYVSISYAGTVNWKTILDDVAAQMGVVVSYAHDVAFTDIGNGYSFVGQAKDVLTKGCSCCGLSWSIQNGVLQVKKNNGVMSREVYTLSPETGLIGIPARIELEKGGTSSTSTKQLGWEVEYLLSGAINIDDCVHLDTGTVKGYFRVHKQEYSGSNQGGDWTCRAELLEVS